MTLIRNLALTVFYIKLFCFRIKALIIDDWLLREVRASASEVWLRRTAVFCAAVRRVYRTSGGNDHWIGLYKSAPLATDNCYWLDGSPSTFRNWLSGEPDTTSECIRMIPGGQFRDIGCNSQYQYVCKRDEGIYALIGN